jgi:hypothetical protein
MAKTITRAAVATALAGAAAVGALAFAGTANAEPRAAASSGCSGLGTPGSDCQYHDLGAIEENIRILDREDTNPSDRTIKADIAAVHWTR